MMESSLCETSSLALSSFNQSSQSFSHTASQCCGLGVGRVATGFGLITQENSLSYSVFLGKPVLICLNVSNLPSDIEIPHFPPPAS